MVRQKIETTSMGGSSGLFGRLKNWVLKSEENEDLFLKCEESDKSQEQRYEDNKKLMRCIKTRLLKCLRDEVETPYLYTINNTYKNLHCLEMLY